MQNSPAMIERIAAVAGRAQYKKKHVSK